MPTAPLVSVLLAVHNGESVRAGGYRERAPADRDRSRAHRRRRRLDRRHRCRPRRDRRRTAASVAKRRAAGSGALVEPRARRGARTIRRSSGCGRRGPAGQDRAAASSDSVSTDCGDRRLGRAGAGRLRAARPVACDAGRVGRGSLGVALQLSLLPSDGARRTRRARTPWPAIRRRLRGERGLRALGATARSSRWRQPSRAARPLPSACQSGLSAPTRAPARRSSFAWRVGRSQPRSGALASRGRARVAGRRRRGDRPGRGRGCRRRLCRARTRLRAKVGRRRSLHARRGSWRDCRGASFRSRPRVGFSDKRCDSIPHSLPQAVRARRRRRELATHGATRSRGVADQA